MSKATISKKARTEAITSIASYYEIERDLLWRLKKKISNGYQFDKRAIPDEVKAYIEILAQHWGIDAGVFMGAILYTVETRENDIRLKRDKKGGESGCEFGVVVYDRKYNKHHPNTGRVACLAQPLIGMAACAILHKLDRSMCTIAQERRAQLSD